MNLNRRTVISHVAAASMALAGMLSAFQSAAQDYPNKPIRLVVPAPAGVGPDIEMRRMSAHLSTILGQPVIIENRPGAATRIGIEYVIKSAPDGYTLLVGTPSMVTGPFLFSNLPFDAQRDLVPVALASVTNYTLTINADVPAKTFAEYIALAKSDPKYADFATLGAGTILHLTAAWFGSLTGVNTRYIHYNTSSPFAALAAGQVPAMFDAMLPVLQLRNAGKLRTLGISGSKRHPLMPDVPTFAEVGHPGFQPLVWTGVMAPAGTPPAIVNKLSAAFSQVLKMKETVDFFASVGSEAVGSTPDEYAAFLDGERKKWGPIIRTLGVKLD